MSVKKIAEGYLKVEEDTGTISNLLTIEGIVELPSTTNLNGSSLQANLDSKVSLENPTVTSTISFENLQINSVPLNTLISNSTTITFGNAFIVLSDIYTIQIPFSSSVTLPYTANIVVNEIASTAMTVVITEYNTNYVQFRIMRPVFDYIIINSFKTFLNINCAIMKGATVIACGNVALP